MEVTVKGTTKTLKFNYKALFNANKDYSTYDANNNNMGDGATNLFTRILTSDTPVIIDIIKVAGGFGKISDDDLFDAVDEITEDGAKIDEVLAELKDELKNSGFFLKSITAQRDAVAEALPMIKSKEQTDEIKQQVTAIERILKLLNENL
ncbi:hypothetical protein KII95_08750 [Leuconostoc gelidum subsp. aenigmaticum]|uniref:tail assembly chaperone n=1 Tax=Leuconostoc gelidum TaxID=1244 RepID=UPI001CC58BD5|nr:tail assembly chaperone [Leuconostoc gelidum]MBZ6004096.1 hypothetical protein [Leuconostoc gelidum subsp. aenigmaticum]